MPEVKSWAHCRSLENWNARVSKNTGFLGQKTAFHWTSVWEFLCQFCECFFCAFTEVSSVRSVRICLVCLVPSDVPSVNIGTKHCEGDYTVLLKFVLVWPQQKWFWLQWPSEMHLSSKTGWHTWKKSDKTWTENLCRQQENWIRPQHASHRKYIFSRLLSSTFCMTAPPFWTCCTILELWLLGQPGVVLLFGCQPVDPHLGEFYVPLTATGKVVLWVLLCFLPLVETQSHPRCRKPNSGNPRCRFPQCMYHRHDGTEQQWYTTRGAENCSSFVAAT